MDLMANVLKELGWSDNLINAVLSDDYDPKQIEDLFPVEKKENTSVYLPYLICPLEPSQYCTEI